jgi:hypothetical protein
MKDKPDLDVKVLAAVRAHPEGVSPAEIHESLERDGASSRAVRSAIMRLWDEGRLNLGGDKKLRVTGK